MNPLRRILRSDERGISLAEVLVGMALAMVVTTIVVIGVVAIYRAHNYSDDDSQALASLRTAVGRLERELRGSAAIYADSTAQTIHFWVDSDRDNQRDLVERVTWALTPGQNSFTRTTEAAGAPVTVVARGLVDAPVFAYLDNASAVPNDPERATLVEVTLSAGGDGNSLAGVRTVKTEVRLRNVST